MTDLTSQFMTSTPVDPDEAAFERKLSIARATDAASEESPFAALLGPVGQRAFTGYVKTAVQTMGITNRMAAGLTEAALQVYNTVESGVQAVAEAVVGEQPSQTTMADLVTGQQKPKAPAPLATPTWNDAPIKEALTRLRDESRAEAERQLAGEDSLAGNLTEGAVQFMVPFSMALKTMGGLKAGATATNIAKGAAAEAVTMFGAFDPHAGRFADLVRAVSPDGLASNRYIDYLTNRENEGELEGRFKNVVDSLSGSAAVAGALKVGGTTLRAAHLAATTPSPTKLQAQRGSMSLKTLPANAEELAYHGTTKQAAAAIEKEGFDLTRSADGTVWLTSNPNIGEVAATGKGGIISRSVSGLKLGSWDEMDKYSTDELIAKGYDGLRLKDGEEITYQIFNPEKLQMPKPNQNTWQNMSREEFLGSPKITTNRNAVDLKPRALNTVVTEQPKPFKENLTIRMNEDGAAVYDGDKVVASYNFGNTLVVDSKYRKQGIGEELVYQWRKANPTAPPAKERTKASQAIQEKVWQRLLNEQN